MATAPEKGNIKNRQANMIVNIPLIRYSHQYLWSDNILNAETRLVTPL